MGVLRSVAHRRAESRFLGRYIAVHRAFVLGLGARHRGIVELSEDRCVCDSVRLLFTFTYFNKSVSSVQTTNYLTRSTQSPRHVTPHGKPPTHGAPAPYSYYLGST